MSTLRSLYIFSIFIYLALNVFNVCAAQSLNHNDAVADALRHSPDLKMRAEDIHISDAQYKVSFAGLLPSVNLSGRAERYENLDTRNTADIETIGNEVVGGKQTAWRSSVNVTGQYYFSHWYKKRHETKYYEQLKESSIHQCESEAKKIIREVTELYGSLLEARMKLDYSNRIAQCLREIFKIKKAAFRMGHYSFEDLLKAEAEAVSVDREIARIQKDLTDMLHRLGGFTGGIYDESSTLEPLEYTGEIAFVDGKAAIAEAPEYKMRLREMEAHHSKTIAARNNLLPDISVYARYDLFNSSPDSLDASMRDTRPSSYSAGVLLSVPLFDGGAKYWEWKKNLYESRRQKESVRATYEGINKEIKTIHDGYVNLTKSYLHFKKLHDQYARMATISKKAQELGERSRLDMLELDKDALAVERDLKITEQMLAVYEKQMRLEQDYYSFLRAYDGNRACRD